ncbi:MAG: acetate--CoA ligase family protein [Pseudomonas sp.]
MSELDFLFHPKSIAVVGASDNLDKIGGKVLATLQRHNFKGQIFPINPNQPQISGLACYRSIREVGKPIDLALIAIPAKLVPQCVQECADHGIKSVVIFSSGFSDSGEAGYELQKQIDDIRQATGIRISGPNAEGFFSIEDSIAATFSPAINIDKGDSDATNQISIVSQSGGLGFSFYNRGRRSNLSFGHIISVGNQADLEIADYASYFIAQPKTKAVMMYVESLKTPQKFLDVANQAADAQKPIVMVKVGTSKAGKRAAESHTGAIASSDKVIDAFFRHNGIILGNDQDRLLDQAAAVVNNPLPKGNRVAIVSASGGTAVWLADACEAAGLEVPELSDKIRTQLAEFIPDYGSTNNPVDITAQGVNGYARSLEILGSSPDIDAIILAATFAHEGRLINEGEQIAQLSRELDKPVLVYSYTIPSEGSLKRLKDLGLHCYTSLQGCVAGLKALWDYSLFQQNRLSHTPAPRTEADIPSDSRRLIEASGRILVEYQSKKLLTQYGVEVPSEKLVISAEEAAHFAESIGYPVVLKVQSPEISHKTEAGGVKLGIADAAELKVAFEDILTNARAYNSAANIEGILVQKMMPKGVEIIAGVTNDPDFGPMVMVGLGGIFVEVMKDVQLAPAPLTHHSARALIQRLKGYPLLEGVRGEKAKDIDAVCDVLVQVSNLAWDHRDNIEELDINPIFVYDEGQGIAIMDALAIKKA